MRRTKTRALAALLGLALLFPTSASAGIIPPEFENWFCPLPSFSADTFTIIIKGDQTSFIPPQIASDKLTNPFAYSGNPTSITVTKDGGGNTDIVYTGSAISPGTMFPYPNNEPHFGLNNGVPPPGGFQVLSETWSNSGVPANTLNLPALSIITTPQNLANQANFQFLTIFAQAGGVGTWLEVPYLMGQPPPFQLINNNAGPISLSNVGFFISPTEIPLDQLNFDTLPSPGQGGSTFIPLTSLDGQTLAPGGMVGASVVPEPATMIGLVQGLLGLAGFLSIQAGRRRASAIADPGA